MKTDIELRDDVLAEIEWEPMVEGAGVGATAHDGVITLTGNVGSYLEKTEALHAAQRVAGVAAVADELEVAWQPSLMPSDTDIAAAVMLALTSHAGVPVADIQPVVHDGRVTLNGEVRFQFQRERAGHAVESLRGVRGVANLIRIAERPVNALDVKSKIEAAFRRRADIDASRITVRVDGGTVTLAGTVPTAFERQAAESAAWGAEGLHRVDDHIRVNPGVS